MNYSDHLKRLLSKITWECIKLRESLSKMIYHALGIQVSEVSSQDRIIAALN